MAFISGFSKNGGQAAVIGQKRKLVRNSMRSDGDFEKMPNQAVREEIPDYEFPFDDGWKCAIF